MTPSPEPQARASPGRRAADALLFGFAAWTLLCHATVFLGGSLVHLAWGTAALVAGGAAWVRLRPAPAAEP
ncbi:MAG: hypothetical protein MJE66_24740, partial [Proteobacteria bacterium]|nr:hypothetical protein [Pseudomonadota bacterium]